MSKVAKIITVTLMARVIVDENDSDEIVLNEAIPLFQSAIMKDGLQNVESIEDDTEMPYGTLDGEKETIENSR